MRAAASAWASPPTSASTVAHSLRPSRTTPTTCSCWGSMTLPVAGLMSDQPLAAVHKRMHSMEQRLAGMGVTMNAPFMTLSFLALSVIPELKITDQGLVDVARFELVPLGVE